MLTKDLTSPDNLVLSDLYLIRLVLLKSGYPLMLMRKTQFLQQNPKNSFSIKLRVNVGFMLVSFLLWSLCRLSFTPTKIDLLAS